MFRDNGNLISGLSIRENQENDFRQSKDDTPSSNDYSGEHVGEIKSRGSNFLQYQKSTEGSGNKGVFIEDEGKHYSGIHTRQGQKINAVGPRKKCYIHTIFR